ncbi:MAG: dephospho-CoA kinase [Sandaracinaceae bacterium]
MPEPGWPWYECPVGFAAIGLTGGIGSGKSTVARMFETDCGVPVVDADQIAREVVAPGSDGLRDVVRRFGDDVLSPAGELDRAKLAERVFDDPDERRALESILHPRIGLASMQRMAKLATEGHAYAIYEAALLVENGSYKSFAGLIVVSVDEATQLARVAARDGQGEDAARARIAAQLPTASKVAVADYVIDNSGSLEETRQQVRAVHGRILERFGGSGT